MKHTRPMALGAIIAALSIVLMLLGAVLELGTYAAPMLCGLLLIPLGNQWGIKYQTACYIAVSLLSFLLIPNAEQNLIYAGLFGWYPIARPALQKLPPLLRLLAKAVIFNVVILAVEALVLLVLAPEAMTNGMIAILLILANITFLAYDLVIPKAELLTARILNKKSLS